MHRCAINDIAGHSDIAFEMGRSEIGQRRAGGGDGGVCVYEVKWVW